MIRTVAFLLLAVLLAALAQSALGQSSTIVYRCPGNVYTSDRELTAKQADEKGCKVDRGHADHGHPGPDAARRARPAAPRRRQQRRRGRRRPRVDPAAQRARDSDARRILEGELRREEERLAELKPSTTTASPSARATSATTRSTWTAWPS